MSSFLSQIKYLGIELKVTFLFGVTSLILSLLGGLLAGNGFGNALVTSLTMMLVFSALGYAIVFVLKRFVPEVFETLQSAQTVEEIPAAGGRFERNIGDAGEDMREMQPEAASEETEFAGMDVPKRSGGIDFEPMDRAELKQFNSRAYVGEGRMGKHIVVDEKKIKYEPKVVAEAIRTMMKRDNE